MFPSLDVHLVLTRRLSNFFPQGTVGRGLEGEQLGVGAGLPHQLCVRALLDDPAAVHDQDPIGVADGREAVRDEQHGATRGQRSQPLEQVVLSSWVQRCRRLIQDQEPAVSVERPGQRDPLPLATRQVGAVLELAAQHGLETVGQ